MGRLRVRRLRAAVRIQRDHVAVGVVVVVVVVGVGVRVDPERAGGLFAEQACVVRVLADRFRRAAAADMPVKAEHVAGLTNHQVQVVTDHQHREAMPAAQSGDQLEQRGLADDVDPLQRLVQDQHVRPAQQRARQRDPLEFAARQGGQLAVDRALAPCAWARLRSC